MLNLSLPLVAIPLTADQPGNADTSMMVVKHFRLAVDKMK